MWMGLGHKFINKLHKQANTKMVTIKDFLAKTACHIRVPFQQEKGRKKQEMEKCLTHAGGSSESSPLPGVSV